ncbi:rac GTPase-activating protein 1-like isoform X2 [Melanotaenia boesemani]|uniref:rac GTPase-activating protein 1-like isoform X2 n=1 Tax=Melanotaenia boesemani TaxID=1250792 RepID=UPI001C0441BF|nr:rac GTPase-activating protein 1-like isoform X2 [Melanotaenia boesemani]
MEESRVLMEDILSLYQQRINMEESNMRTELEMMKVVQNLEEVRNKWLQTKLELKKFKELLVKSDVAKAALEVKLKHTRNQLDVEMKRRLKVEADYHYLDLDTAMIKPLRSRARERRRSSMDPAAGSLLGKRSRGGNVSAELLERKTVEQEVETVVKAVVTTPDTFSQIHTVLGITQEHLDKPAHNITQEDAISGGGPRGTPAGDQTSIWFPCDNMVVEPQPKAPPLDGNVYSSSIQKILKHVFLSKTVIRPETCAPCGKRIRFGKVVVKCRNCRLVAHLDCKQRLTNGCSPSSAMA